MGRRANFSLARTLSSARQGLRGAHRRQCVDLRRVHPPRVALTRQHSGGPIVKASHPFGRDLVKAKDERRLRLCEEIGGAPVPSRRSPPVARQDPRHLRVRGHAGV